MGADIHIFDSHFINENVHGSEQVEADQRRNYYRIMIGEHGVALAAKLDALDLQITELNTQIATEKKSLQQHVPQGLTLEKFLAIAKINNVDAEVEKVRTSLKAAEQSAAIASKQLLEPVSIPALPSNYEALLAKTLENISAEAAKRIQDQLALHDFQKDGEQWLETGLLHLQNDNCPFCGQELTGVAIVDAYKDYFSAAYASHKAGLIELRSSVESSLSEATGLRLVQSFRNLLSEISFWRGFTQIEFELPDAIGNLQERLASLSKASLAQIDRKISAPLDVLSVSDDLHVAIEGWNDISSSLSICNGYLATANTLIGEIKKTNSLKDKNLIAEELASLLAAKARHSEPSLALANKYNALIARKDALIIEKDTAKRELDDYDAGVITRYEAVINKYLSLFGAGFRLVKTTKNYIGKIPQVAYQLEIETSVSKQTLDISTKEVLGKPSFRTTMSSGDKNTIALAFFLAQIELDDAIARKIVVFDDPFTSLDDFRREVTAKSIFRIGEIAAQTLIFSHDKYFLQSVHKKIQGSDCETFQISVSKNNAAIETWNIEREVKEGYLQDHMILLDFVKNDVGNAREMRTLMRPLLEKYIRYRFPNQIPEGKWLGDMLAIIRSTADHPLQAAYQEIDDINQYTAPFHHDPNTAFNSDEVKTYVERTLKIVGGC